MANRNNGLIWQLAMWSMLGTRRKLALVLVCAFVLVTVTRLIADTQSLGYASEPTETIKHELNRSMALRQSNPRLWNVTSAKCVDQLAVKYERVEDIFCMNIPDWVARFKNPCFYQYKENIQTVLRCFPYFYIIGMDKSGTTDLHNRIAAHPQIRGNKGSLQKETQFWAWKRYGVFNYSKTKRKETLEIYSDYFQDIGLELLKQGSPRNIITGDGTPMDLWDFRGWKSIPQNFGLKEPDILTPHLFKYVHKETPPKMLIQLREPVERMYSDYIFLQQGINPDTFHAHVLKALSILQECIKEKGRRLCFFDDLIYHRIPTRLHLSCYSVYIKEWLKVFPLSAFHVTRTEDFTVDMKGHLAHIFNYLGVDSLPDDKLQSIAAKDRKHVTIGKKGTIRPDTFALLKEFYRPCLEETAELLGDRKFLWEDVYAARSVGTDANPNLSTRSVANGNATL